MTFMPLVLFDTRIWYGQLDASGFSNKVNLAASVAAEDSSTFGNAGWQANVGGLKSTSITATMLWQAGDLSMPDDVMWAKLGTSDQPLTVVPTAGAVNDIAYLTKSMECQDTIGGDVAKLVTIDGMWMGNSALARGRVMHPAGTARTADGDGTAVQLGAVAAGKRMYANLHVLSVAGTGTPTLTAVLASSATSTGSYTDRITFDDATARSGQCASASAPITDTWWRASWTIDGTSPSFLFAISAGIATR